jgi:WD40 repeat protein
MRRLSVAFAMCGALGCGGDAVVIPPAPVAAIVTISPVVAAIFEGASVSLTARVLDNAGKPLSAPVTWTSSDPDVATVDAAGTLRAIHAGTVTLSVSVIASPVVTASATVLVEAVPARSIRLTPSSGRLYAGKSIQLTAAVLDSAGGALLNRTVTWTSNDTAKARVSATGMVQTIAYGAVQITARSEGAGSSVAIDILPGDDFVFQNTVGGVSRLFTMNADGGARTEVAPGPASSIDPAWSPDGKRIAFVSYTANAEVLRIATVGDSVPQTLSSTRAPYVASPAWSPDGKEIAFASSATPYGSVHVINLASGTTRLITSMLSSTGPRWSPDGRLISYGNLGALIVNNKDGTNETVIRTAGVRSQCWGDATHLYYWVDELYEATVTPTGVTSRQRTALRTSDPGTATCSGAGRAAIMINADGNTHIATYVVNTDGTGLTLLPLPANTYTSTAWSGDGTRLFVTTVRLAPNSGTILETALLEFEPVGTLTPLLNSVPFYSLAWNPRH